MLAGRAAVLAMQTLESAGSSAIDRPCRVCNRAGFESPDETRTPDKTQVDVVRMARRQPHGWPRRRELRAARPAMSALSTPAGRPSGTRTAPKSRSVRARRPPSSPAMCSFRRDGDIRAGLATAGRCGRRARIRRGRPGSLLRRALRRRHIRCTAAGFARSPPVPCRGARLSRRATAAQQGPDVRPTRRAPRRSSRSCAAAATGCTATARVD